jgi:hypothetical protein
LFRRAALDEEAFGTVLMGDGTWLITESIRILGVGML